MRHIAPVITVVLLACAQTAAQQTGLTDAQITSAEVEIPQLVGLLELKPGVTVGDVGAGFGAWTMRFARELGPTGRVYATDIGAAQLAALRDITQRERLTNVTVIAGAANSTNLPPLCCDAILIRDAYHHLTQPEAVIRSLAASLKPGGRLAVIDFPPRPDTEVPAGVPANRGGHGVPSEVVQGEVSFVLTYVRTITAWSPASQPASLYLVLFRKP
ncbi:MAG TPA: class I SAM-dependent methyltransferase [Vicinamibacterales bacterium]|nr:class I SAM-dependent methyltransferase [Vicinamibacterales bacterium]